MKAVIRESHFLSTCHPICISPISSRGRGGAVPPPPPPGRGVLTPRGTTVTRGALPVPPVARGVPTPRARGTAAVPGYRAPPPPAPEAYEEYVSTRKKAAARKG